MSAPRSILPVALLSLLAAGCADLLDIPDRRLAGQGLCEGTVRIRVAYDMTDVTREVAVPVGKGLSDYLHRLQDTGGIHGCPLEIDVKDTKYDEYIALGIYDEWKARADWDEVSVIFAGGQKIVDELAPRAAEHDKLLFTNSYLGRFAAPEDFKRDVEVPSLGDDFLPTKTTRPKKSAGYPYLFFAGTDYSTAARIGVAHALSQGAHRIGFFACSDDLACTDPIDAAKLSLPAAKIGRDLTIPRNADEASVRSAVLTYFQAEVDHRDHDASYQPVDWIWFGNNAATAPAVGKALSAVQADLKLTVKVIANVWGVDEELYQACGDACLGFATVQPFVRYGDPDAAGMTNLVAIHDAYRRADGEDLGKHRNLDYVHGYVTAAAWHRAVESALAAGDQVTGASVRAALERFAGEDLEGFAQLTFGPKDHRPQSSARIYTVGKFGELTLEAKPALGPPSPEELWW